MELRFLKLLHLIGVVVFMGNIVVTALWKALADRSDDPRVVAFAQRLVTVTDVVFTGAGAALVAATGLVMAPRYGGVLQGPAWLVWGWWLFVISGVIWIAILVPIQVKQWRIVQTLEDGQPVPERYHTLASWWLGWGLVASLIPAASMVLMVLRPL
jgi:uncharacterized membrane protein